MKICIVGCGFVGLTTGVVLAHIGHRVHLVDIDEFRIKSIVDCNPPFFEPGLKEMLSSGIKNGRITAGTDAIVGTRKNDFIFICVQTPLTKSGAYDLKYLKSCTKMIARGLTPGAIIIVKSTVPPETSVGVIMPMLEKYSGLRAGKDFGIAMNPEFLQEGKAVSDSLRPNRIVVGALDKKCAEKVMSLYSRIDAPRLFTDLTTAEMIKTVSNCFLANKISFANETANLCEKIGVDVRLVMRGVGLDPRIGPQFLNAGLGFGGSCLPKDLSAMIAVQRKKKLPARLLRAVEAVNDDQPIRAVNILEEVLGSLNKKRIAILGLAFKNGVDDVRDTRALLLATELMDRGSKVVGYDKLAEEAFRGLLNGIEFAPSASKAISGADGCIIQTEDLDFTLLSKRDFSSMRTKVVIDGRGLLDGKKLKSWGVTIRTIGLGEIL